MTSLAAIIRRDLQQPAPDGLEGLLAALHERYGQALRGVLIYGSCRRDVDIHSGVVDLLVLVERYRAVLRWPGALANQLLPPNVYFLQVGDSQPVRCKYALVSISQFARRCASRADHYFWARFTQPCRLLWAADEAALADALTAARVRAARTFCTRFAPMIRQPVDAEGFWTQALAATYRCELRPESPSNASRLIAADPGYWQALTQALAAEPGSALETQGSRFQGQAGRWRSARARIDWRLRQISGKCFNLARLFKAAGTFSNGIDYITWKVERHSGVRIEPTEQMRRYPRLAAWGLAWRMWRQGGFR